MSDAVDVGEADFNAQVLQSATPVLVDLWAPWCGPCKMVGPIVDKVAKDMKGRLKVVKLNTDESPSIAGKYEVSSIPSLILFKGGEPVDRIVGYVPERQIVMTVEKHANRSHDASPHCERDALELSTSIPGDSMEGSLRRAIPAVHRFTADPDLAAFNGLLGRAAVRSAVQRVLDEARDVALSTSSLPDDVALKHRMLGLLAASESAGLLRVINGTGVLLHTNFGRAPLAAAALAAMSDLGAGYTNLEFDLATGKRGSRYERVAGQLRELTGAQASLVVNNCAAAVVLVLDTFANGRDVVVSRGQLVEIGGGFRLPDVLRKSGATLVEVGTTNKTYASDYRDAWSPNTAIFMRTHPSNYRVEGFTAEVSAQALAALAKELDVVSFEDLGSGALIDFAPYGLPAEPTVAQEIAAGIDLVAVSGDKLLGGPQCGIICGRADLIARLRANPLLRALRTDKTTIAALCATLAIYLEPERLAELPLLSMLRASSDDLFARAAALCAALAGSGNATRFRPVCTRATTGGGTMPTAEIASAGVAATPKDIAPHELAARMSTHRPPVIGRIQGDDFIVDLRTVRDDEDADLRAAFLACT